MDSLPRVSPRAIEMSRDGSRSSSHQRAETSDEGEVGGTGRKSEQPAWNWDADVENPYNWSSGKKAWQVAMISSSAFLA